MQPDPQHRARTFIVLMGLVAMFGDMTYEGARGLVGPYLGLLGASATAIGLVAGAGELLGYGLRLVTGALADRTRGWWALVVLGYGINLVAVPGLALVGSWEAAVVLVLLERVGKAVRSPSRSTLVSYASSKVGAGWSFGLDEALDQLGAVTGPLLTALAIWVARDEPIEAGYRLAFAVLLLPVFANLALVLTARRAFPTPADFEAPSAAPAASPALLRAYTAAAGLLALGFADWALIAFHAARTGTVSLGLLPVLYAAVMGADALAALALGAAFDRIGLAALAGAAALSALVGPFVFLGSGPAILVVGALVWGVGMGAQDSILKAAIATMVPKERRSAAYGMFFAWFGAAWWVGSALSGWLYDRSLPALAAFSAGTQLLAAVGLLAVWRRLPR